MGVIAFAAARTAIQNQPPELGVSPWAHLGGIFNGHPFGPIGLRDLAPTRRRLCGASLLYPMPDHTSTHWRRPTFWALRKGPASPLDRDDMDPALELEVLADATVRTTTCPQDLEFTLPSQGHGLCTFLRSLLTRISQPPKEARKSRPS